MQTFFKDLAYGMRSLRRNPGFAITVIITLALGIGASTAIFSVVNAVLLRPLPYVEPERLVHISSDMRTRHVTDFPFATGDLGDLREQGTLFSGIAAISSIRGSISGDDREPEQIRTAFVTPNIATVLGLRIAVGRNFTESDGTPNAIPPQPQPGQPAAAQPQPQVPRLPNFALISHGFWQRRYGSDSSVIGRSVDLGGGPVVVVGVLAPNAEVLLPPELDIERVPDIWLAMRLRFDDATRTNVQHRLIGRLKPGVTYAQAQAQLDQIATDLRRRFPIKESVGMVIRLEPLQADLVANVQRGLVALMVAVIFVLLIACANVANLLLVRAGRRERELVVRSALGGQRWRLIRQMLAESLVLALGGAVAGLLLAELALGLLKMVGPANLPRLDEVSIDGWVLGFTTLATLASALLFGMLPALRASRTDVADALRGSARTAGLQAAGGLRNLVVTAEVALSFVLLIGSGLMLRSFVALQHTDLGFDPHHLLTFYARNNRLRSDTARAAFMRTYKEKLMGLPGVQGVTAATPFPLDGQIQTARWGTQEALSDPNAFHQGNVFFVEPGYFETMKMKVLAGRTFTEADNDPKVTNIVVDELLAKRAFGNEPAVGKRILSRIRTNDPEWFDIIGVVAHQRHDSLATQGREAIYFTDGILGYGVAARWAVRVDGDPLQLASAVRAATAQIDPSVAVAEVQPMRAFVDKASAQTRFSLVLIAVFAGIAALLAAVGLYGVLSSLVRQRTAEIGVRMALGAPRENIFRLVIAHGLRLTGIGVVIGLVGALVLTRLMTTMLVGVRPTDPLTFSVIVLLFLGIAALACWLPARRAADLQPTIALREEG